MQNLVAVGVAAIHRAYSVLKSPVPAGEVVAKAQEKLFREAVMEFEQLPRLVQLMAWLEYNERCNAAEMNLAKKMLHEAERMAEARKPKQEAALDALYPQKRTDS